MKHYCNFCRDYTETIDVTDCIICDLSKTNYSLDEVVVESEEPMEVLLKEKSDDET